MLGSQPGDAGVRLVRNLDAEATALIAPERATEVVNILREAVSNSLRHGRAHTITVHARQWRRHRAARRAGRRRRL